MGLTSSLYIGQSALVASQVALQVTGNNIANVGTPGYHRQRVILEPVRGTQISERAFVGRGVGVADIRRAVDPALQTRLRNSISDEQGAGIDRQVLGQIESVLGELGENDVSSELSRFFSAFSELANNPGSTVNYGTVVEQGGALAARLRAVRSDLVDTSRQIENQLATNVTRASGLLGEIAGLNRSISTSELSGLGGQNGALRDQRDQLLSELSALIDITTVEQDNGVVDVLVGSTPVVLAATSRGVELDIRTVDGELDVRVLVSSTREKLDIQEGTIGGLLRARESGVDSTLEDLDDLAASLIFEVNRLHSSGRPASRQTDVTGELFLPLADRTRAFNDPANLTLAELPFAPRNGDFRVVITDASGNKTVTSVHVDLDGITSTGAAGFADDTSLASLTATLDAIGNLNATITPEGRLRLTTDAGYDVSFEGDTSGALATLGINAYFQGTDASTIDVRQELKDDPLRLTVGLGAGTNETALSIAQLRDRGLEALGGQTIAGSWLKRVEQIAVRTREAGTRADAASAVRQSLDAQEAAISGVSLDEEAINLVSYQQQYAGAARFISVINELTDVLINLV